MAIPSQSTLHVPTVPTPSRLTSHQPSAHLLDLDAEDLAGHEGALAEGDGVGEAGLAVGGRVVVAEDNVGAVVTVEVVGARHQGLAVPDGAQAGQRGQLAGGVRQSCRTQEKRQTQRGQPSV